jgi:Ca2+-binding RTX toxin-like protein
VVLVTGQNGTISILRLSTQIDIFNLANDRIIINGLGGDDVIEGCSLLGGLAFTANGGDGDDVLIGGSIPKTVAPEMTCSLAAWVKTASTVVLAPTS